MCAEGKGGVTGGSEFLHPPAEGQIESQVLIYSKVTLKIHGYLRIPPITLLISGGGGGSGLWIAEADSPMGSTSNRGRVLHRTDQTRPPLASPPSF